MDQNLKEIVDAVPELETIFSDLKQIDGVFATTEDKLGRAEELMKQLEKQLQDLKEALPVTEGECEQKIEEAAKR